MKEHFTQCADMLQRYRQQCELYLRAPHFFIFRIIVSVALFFLYIADGVLYTVSVLFFSSSKSFEHFYTLNPKKGYAVSFSGHRSWQRRVRFSALSSFLIILSITVVNGALISNGVVFGASYTVNCSGTSASPTDLTGVTDETIYTNGDTITFANTGGNGYCQLDQPINVGAGSITLSDGVVLTQVATDIDGVNLTAATITLNGTASINVTGKGYAGGTLAVGGGTGGGGYSSTSYRGGGGGAYGGDGGTGGTAQVGGTAYGTDEAAPANLGSGGGASGQDGINGNQRAGGNGGGYVRLNATGTVTINSSATIIADGNTGAKTNGSSAAAQTSSGAGSGGAIYITANSYAGSGAISANGGTSVSTTTANYRGGGGGGGRIFLSYSGTNNYTGTLTASGGDGYVSGEAGTGAVYDSTNNTIKIYEGYDFRSTNSPYTYAAIDLASANIRMKVFGASSAVALNTTSMTNSSTSTWICKNGSTDFTFTSTNSAIINNSTWTGCDDVAINSSNTGAWTVTNTAITSATGNINIDISDALTLVSSTLTTTTVQKSINITTANSLSLQGTTFTGNVNGITTQDITLDSTSSIVASGKGYTGGTLAAGNGTGGGGYSSAAYRGGGGGGYGGAGGTGGVSQAAGIAYGADEAAPANYGSGGGASGQDGVNGTQRAGGNGGGRVILTASGTFTLASGASIVTNGVDGQKTNGGTVSAQTSSGGGSGGAIYITAGSLAGEGSFSANGGLSTATSTANYQGGGGGGGRILLSYTGSNNFTGTVTATGGAGYVTGTAGTAAVRGITDNSLKIYDGYDFRSTSSPYTYETIQMANATSRIHVFGASSAVTLNTTSMTNTATTTWTCKDSTTDFTFTVVNAIALNNSTWTACDDLSISSSNNDVLTLSNASITSTTGGITLDVSDDLTLNSSTLTTTARQKSINITAANSLTMQSSTITGNMDSFSSGNLTIDGSSSITGNGKGPAGGTLAVGSGTGGGGYSSAAYRGGGGAGYGATGGTGGTVQAGGVSYGSVTNPTDYGSGGGASGQDGMNSTQASGGSGGGKIGITLTGTLNVASGGGIYMNGNTGAKTNGSTAGAQVSSGAGSGGSINIATVTLTGAGTIQANGGTSVATTTANYRGGGGAGGRIHYSYVNVGSWAGSVTATGGTGYVNGGDGTVDALALTTASQPTIIAPIASAQNQSQTPTITASDYSSNGAIHTSSDWKVTTDSDGNNSVWSKNGDTSNKTSTIVNSTNGTFSGGLTDQLNADTTYYVFVRYNNMAGASTWSPAAEFTTLFTGAASTQIWEFNDAVPSSVYTYNSTNLEVNASSNSIARLKQLGDGAYPVAAQALLANWTKRASITVTNAIASDLTNYQIRVPVTYDSDMQADFDDIRFTSSDGTTLIDHWLETKTDSTSAVFWVEVPSIPASGNATIYLHYGNGSAISTSSADNTFLFADTFDGPSLVNGWTQVTGTGQSAGTFSAGKWTKSCNTSGASGCDWWTSNNLDSGAYVTGDPGGTAQAWEALTVMSASTSPTNSQAGMMLYNSATSGYMWGLYNTGTSTYRVEKTGTGNLCNTAGTTTPLYLKIQKSTSAAANSANTYKFYSSTSGSASWAQCGSYAPSDTMANVGLVTKAWGSGTVSGTFDYFIIKKYASTEPTVGSIGSEQAIATYDNVKIMPSATGTHPFFGKLYAFTETAGAGNQGTFKYQIGLDSNRDGTVDGWYYLNGTTWTAVNTDATDNSSASVVNAYLPSFVSQVGTGDLYFKAFLVSNGAQATELDSLTVTYNAVPTSSTIPTQTLNEDTSENAKFDLDNYFTDPEGAALTWSVVDGLSAGLGTMTVNSNGTVDFALASNAIGSDTVQFRATDEDGLTTDSNSVTINVNDVNDTPTFTKGADQSVNEDASEQTVNDWATSISKGPANESSQTVSFNVANDNNSLFSVQPSIAANGTLTYTPAANANGVATVTISISDNGGTSNGGDDRSDDQTFTITVNTVNDVPSFTKGADQNMNEDAGAQTITGWATGISAGPSNESGQTLSFNVANDNNALFSVQPAIAENGTLTYTPAANANGSTTVTISLADNGGTANSGDDTSDDQTFTITVNSVNDAPVFTKGADQSVNEDAGAQTASGWATGIGPGAANESSQTVSFNVANDNNSLFSVQPAIAANGTLTYTPVANANGVATVTISISDNGGTSNGGDDTSDDQTFTITVNSVDDVPSFTKGADQAINEDTGAQTVTGWATGISAGPSNESGETVSFNVTNDNNALFSVQPAVAANGTLTYTPAANANGSTTVTVTISDNGGTANGGVDTSASQTFTVTVNAVNDAPSFIKGSNQNLNENAGAQTVTGWATAISAGPSDESGQTLSVNISNDNNALFSVQPAVSTNGTLTYTPAPNASGSATVAISLSDDGGTANGGDDRSDDQTFTISFNGINHAPSFTKGADQTVNEDAGLQTVNNWATSLDPGGLSDAGQLLHFNTSNNNTGLFSVQPAVAANGTLTYTPAANANGTATITISLSDDGGSAGGGDDTSDDETFTITVNAANDTPAFTKGADQSVNEDAAAQTVTTWATGISAGPSNESAQIVSFNISNDNNGLFSVQPSVAANGTLTYTPAPNANGSALVAVSLSDDGDTANGGDNRSDDQTFMITLNAVNDAPVANAGIDQNVNEDDNSVELDASGSTDIDTDTLTYAWIETVDSGDGCSLDGNTDINPIVGIANDDSNYSCEFRVTANDGHGGTAQDTVTVNVGADNDAPVVPSITDKTVNEGDQLQFAVSASDVDTDTLELSATDGDGSFAEQGVDVEDQFTDNGNNTGIFTWTPNESDSGSYVAEIEAGDGDNTTTRLVNITVADTQGTDTDPDPDQNSAPEFSGSVPNVSFMSGTTTTFLFDLDDYFTDEDGDSLTYAATGQKSITVTVEPSGEVLMSAADSFVGTEAVQFVATDSSQASATSNPIVVTVEEATVGSSTDIDHVLGTHKGKGLVTLRDKNNGVIAEWIAFQKGGVIPRIQTIKDVPFIFAIKRKSGSTLHVYNKEGTILQKKRLSPKLHYRKMDVGQLDHNRNTIEIVIATKRDHAVYFKVFSFNPQTRVFTLKKRAMYRPLAGIQFRVAIQKKLIQLRDIQGKLRFLWTPFE